ncbi:tetraspanin-18-like [Pomacea canaliculata]|uniref:tetraspanin-18-like n=1 Tax=Pomacea canaliculata TaxID=400727 RepID=UPI000D738A7F|nr:tetraspanin-18-like [Pomacea canaliculata]XP_025110271.1 tetraspanin-18-like [Pomacea canaliculata]XP_025110272.1 tetraspanin-18-like [Pomacea canaliculata]
MTMEGCPKCMKITLVIFNVLVLLVGGVVLGLGIYAHVTDFITGLSAVVGSDLFRAGSILIIVAGALMVVISFLGCCGAWQENRIMLGMYFATILILVVFFIAASISGFVFRDKMRGYLEQEAEKSLIKDYGFNTQVTNDWDVIQTKLECCGVKGDQNSETSWAIYKIKTEWFKNNSTGQYVPNSCCSPTSNKGRCTGVVLGMTLGPPRDGPPITAFMDENDDLYKTGCYDKFWNFIETHALIVGGVAIAAIIVMVIALIFSICVCREVVKQGTIV